MEKDQLYREFCYMSFQVAKARSSLAAPGPDDACH